MSDPIPEQKRRLAAVVFTDVVGYSTRMQRDESATISGVETDLARMRALCLDYGGDVLNSMGDGLIEDYETVRQISCAYCAIRGDTPPHQLRDTPSPTIVGEGRDGGVVAERSTFFDHQPHPNPPLGRGGSHKIGRRQATARVTQFCNPQ